MKRGVAGLACEAPLEGVASNAVRARGRLSPLSNIALAARYNLLFDVGAAQLFVIPHNAVLHCYIL